MNKTNTPPTKAGPTEKRPFPKKNKASQKCYHVYLNKRPHLPQRAGCRLFFESRTHKEAVIFSEQLVAEVVRWFLEDCRYYGPRDYWTIESFQKFVVNFWIEPVGDTPTPAKPFCARRHAAKLLEPHPTILARVAPCLFGFESKN